MRTPTPAELGLYAQAQAAIANAYAPYSRFAVGAALQPAGGAEPITGVNVENASYGLTMCAERSALFAAVSMGHRRFETVAVHADADVRARRAARAGRRSPSSRRTSPSSTAAAARSSRRTSTSCCPSGSSCDRR